MVKAPSELAHSLTSASSLLLAATLEQHGNRLSESHRAALYQLCATLTMFAFGEITGRKVFALSTGLGKTSAIIAWITTVYRLRAGFAVAVSASKVEALCNIKRALMANGVPEGVIGLKHSLGIAASLPSTGDDDRPFMLVTHQRVRGGANHQLFTQHQGEPRAVMIYDESLFRSDCIAISERDVRSDLAYVRERIGGRKGFDGVLGYLDACRERIVSAVAAAREAQGAATAVSLPPIGEVERVGYTELLKGVPLSETLSDLVALAGQELRVAVTPQNEGVLWHRVAVPSDLDRVLVLDASHPIRLLCKLDPTLAPASLFSDAEVKRFDNVTIHQMFAFGGRNSVERSFREVRREKRAVSREVADVVKGVPVEQGVLIFTFKKKKVDIKAILLDDLRAAGVDVEAKLRNGKARINVLTWGDETSLNDFAHCENVILAGVIHRSLLDLASAVVGQLDDRQADIGTQRLLDVLESEIAHAMFQALSRGKCREVDCGQAKPMNAWLIYPRLSIRALLGQAMPGAAWHVWEPRFGSASDGAAVRLALAVLEHLKGLPEGVRKVSTRELKKALAVPQEHARSFSRAVALIDGLCTDWALAGRSVLRVDSGFFGFAPENLDARALKKT